MGFLKRVLFPNQSVNHSNTNYNELIEKSENKVSNLSENGIFFKEKRIKKHTGDIGEHKVNYYLQDLPIDNYSYHDLNFELSDWIWYNNKKNLGSAQVDHIVISKSGIFIIETKNWALDFKSTFSPHEQVDRASKVLFNYIRDNISIFSGLSDKIYIRKLVVSVNNNIKYNPNFRGVYVLTPQRIVNHILNSNNVYTNKEVEKLNNFFKGI